MPTVNITQYLKKFRFTAIMKGERTELTAVFSEPFDPSALYVSRGIKEEEDKPLIDRLTGGSEFVLLMLNRDGQALKHIVIKYETATALLDFDALESDVAQECVRLTGVTTTPPRPL